MPFAWARRSHLICGFETRQNESYHRNVWKKNSKEPWERHVTFQYTLSGEGAFEDEDGVHPLKPGSFFLIGVPSHHSYFLPEHAESWSFAHMAIVHPYIAQRIEQTIAETSTLWTVDCQEILIQQAFNLITAHHQRTFSDEIAEEQALFSWMMEFLRYARRSSHLFKPAELLLTEVRAIVLAALPEALDVPAVAKIHGMSRSHFSHHFRRLTGISPGNYMREVRLQYAADLLRQYHHLTLKDVASQSGFPDVPAFAKIFRARFHTTPGRFSL